jgi:hypothetical protein
MTGNALWCSVKYLLPLFNVVVLYNLITGLEMRTKLVWLIKLCLNETK